MPYPWIQAMKRIKRIWEGSEVNMTYGKPVVPVQKIIPPQINKSKTVVFQPGYGGGQWGNRARIHHQNQFPIPQKPDNNEPPADFLNRASFGQASYHDMPDLLERVSRLYRTGTLARSQVFRCMAVESRNSNWNRGKGTTIFTGNLNRVIMPFQLGLNRASMWFKKAEFTWNSGSRHDEVRCCVWQGIRDHQTNQWDLG